MREAIGGTWLFQIVIVFLLLFAGVICFGVNYSRAFNTKNKIINVIQRDKGLSDTTIIKIGSILKDTGYYATGECIDSYARYSVQDKDTKGSTTNKANYCIKEITTSNNDGAKERTYYKVQVFYQFDLPIFGDLFNFSIKGDTKQM